MQYICPVHQCSPCDCGWKPPKSPFRLFKTYPQEALITAGALIIDGKIYVFVPATDPDLLDVVYEFVKLPSGKFSCEGVGNTCYVQNYHRRAAEGIKLETILSL